MEMKRVFFGTYELLLKIFSMALTNRQTREQLAMVAKRKGVSAKNWWSLRRGISLSRQSVTRRMRATGPGSYSEISPQQEINRLKRVVSALFRADHEKVYGPHNLPYHVTTAEARRFAGFHPQECAL